MNRQSVPIKKLSIREGIGFGLIIAEVGLRNSAERMHHFFAQLLENKGDGASNTQVALVGVAAVGQALIETAGDGLEVLRSNGDVSKGI
ncbi:MAG TPA: hypothetical protein VH234_01265 [Candidatus Saccharimonadales bacterium]|jgi:hypothetical protein|nr:hypothetical protein [Candidatus Saccharimonadales bacterium]